MAIYIKTALQLLLPFIVSGIITLCYLPVYRKKINERLEHFGEGKTFARPIISPLKFFLRTLLIVFILIIVAAFLLAFMFVGVKETGNGQQTGMTSEIFVTNVDSPSMLDNYAPGDDIPGYRITETQVQGDFEVYYYALPEVMYQGFPDGLIGIRYTGNDKAAVRITAEAGQINRNYKYYDALVYAAQPSPVQWYSTDISDFFGSLNITVFAMTEENIKNYAKAADETEDMSGYADAEAEFSIDLAEAYGMDIPNAE